MISWLAVIAAAVSCAIAAALIGEGRLVLAAPILAALPAGLLACMLPSRKGTLQEALHSVDDLGLLDQQVRDLRAALLALSDEQDLQRGVFEVSTELVGCVEEQDAHDRFASSMRRWWACRQVDLMVWERGTWRCLGGEAHGEAPELMQAVQLPLSAGDDLILDLSAAVDGQAALVLRQAEPQPSIAHLDAEIQARVADVLRSQLALSLRRVLLYQELQRLARTDPLTGVHRRWYGERRLEELVEGGEVVAVAVVDIDHFKKVNDTWGHAAGDRVLAAVGAALAKGVRGNDLVCRLGGEEFLVVLPEATPGGATLVGERLRAAVAAIEGLDTKVTVSIGTACVHQDEAAIELIARADRALYQAKAQGRNRVLSAETGVAAQSIRSTGRAQRAAAEGATRSTELG